MSVVEEFRTGWSETASTVVLSLFGELDLTVVDRLEREIDEALGYDRPTVVIDLGGVSFMDATGVRPIYRAAVSCRRSGRRLVVLRGAPCIEILFAEAGLGPAIEMWDASTAAPGLAPLAAGR